MKRSDELLHEAIQLLREGIEKNGAVPTAPQIEVRQDGKQHSEF